MTKRKLDVSTLRPETRLSLAGRDPALSGGAINPPVHHATTLVLDDADALYGTPHKTYALEGMAVQEALCAALVAIEGGADACLAPSGLSACTLALLTLAHAGGELLVSDAVYGPTRRFCETMLDRIGVKTRFYDPRIGGAIERLIGPQTCAVFMESPGSLTFEIQDAPAIAACARAKGVPSVIDNTWSAGVFFKPFAHGVDLSVQALTKYQAGHADAFVGAVVSSTPEWAARVKRAHRELGLGCAPDDAYLALRGLRSLHVRLGQQSASAFKIAQWLSQRPQIKRVLHPALPSHPDHGLWARDFTGASGVFAVEMREQERAKINAMVESLALFAMGFSWGGYESLIIPTDAQIVRSFLSAHAPQGPLLRLSIGLEHPDDLIADLEFALSQL